jgi:uncharacterized Tic20 family protein
MDPQPTPLPPVLPPAPPPTNWRLFLELLSFAGFVFPFGNIVGPLVLWLVKKDTIPQVNEEGKRVVNFNLSWTLWGIVCFGIGLLTCGVGFLLSGAGVVAWLVIAIIAALKAANNEPFQHPLTIAFLK